MNEECNRFNVTKLRLRKKIPTNLQSFNFKSKVY